MGSAEGAVVPLTMIAGMCLLAVIFGQAVRIARRHRWRGEIRPRASRVETTLPWRALGDAEPADSRTARWGPTVEISTAKVRAPGQLRWHQATVFLVNGGHGLVVDPYLSWSRRYVFDDTCQVGPTTSVLTFAAGGAVRIKDFSAVRVADSTRAIDLAIRTEDLPAISLIGQPSCIATADDRRPTRRIAFVEYCDRLTARRRELAGRINARSRVRRRVAAACSLGCLGLAAGFSWLSNAAYEHHLELLGEIGVGAFPALVGVVVYAIRALRPKACAVSP